MKIKIISPGLLATVQDLGRPTGRSSGIPVGGAVDALSHRLANFLVQNEAGAVTLEVAGGGFSARVEGGGWLAVCGAGGRLFLDQKEIGNGRLAFAPEGSRLDIRHSAAGNFAYLTVPGGWDVPELLGSRSTCLAAGFGGFEGRALRQGDVLEANGFLQKSETPNEVWASKWFVPERSEVFENLRAPLRILPGTEMDWWSGAQQEQFFNTEFSVSKQRNRMGLRFDAPLTFLQQSPPRSMLSTAVGPGTLQVPPDGQPIALLADAQTTGGYPRIGQVIAADIPRLAQMPSGQMVRFQKVSLEEAEGLFFEQENLLRQIQVALRINGLAYLAPK